jgi:cellulose biosynthesis protein BcsQ/energy-coupling factor transporter ATP-binding protein EcfA2
VICTFYSYKGGVGRSMAMARAAEILAWAGLRVLMIDFDLEAPGLEQYFEIDKQAMRAHAGLFDLILRYKAAMASNMPTSPEDQDFRKLDEFFIASVYVKLPSGGKLDLMPAGRRGNDQELSEYALGLRQFDWQDFYFNFGGEVFFEWLRRSLDGLRYDVILVDSRTGVTEMGGICAYQLADILVVMCAPNQQNLEGTQAVVRNFFSPRVTTLRGGRPLQLLVVPSRVETRDPDLLRGFRAQFEELFTSFTPKEFESDGMAYWDLLIPYEPRSAFQESVVAPGSRAAARSTINPAIQKLVHAIARLADPQQPIRKLLAEDSVASEHPQAPLYDVTSRVAGYDLFLVFLNEDSDAAAHIARSLGKRGVRVYFAPKELSFGSDLQLSERKAVQQCTACAVIIGPSGDYPWRNEYLRKLLTDKDRPTALRYVPVLLPGAKLPPSDVTPPFLEGLEWLRLRDVDADGAKQLSDALTADEAHTRGATTRASIGPPYKGLAPYDEADALTFFGRDGLIDRITHNLEDSRFVAVVGPSGCGKTSVVLAGVIPALRRGAILGSDRWRFIIVKPDSRPLQPLFEVFGTEPPANASDDSAVLKEFFDRSEDQYLLVIDQFEDAFGSGEATPASYLDQYLEIMKWKAKVAVIIVMRSDLLNKLLEFGPLWTGLVEDNIVLVGPMTDDEMRKAIEEPARSAGLAVEPGLTDLILHDAKGAAGALPLMQYVLHELWERSQKGYLTVEAYKAIGGLTGSLERNAEDCFERLPSADKDTAMAVLLNLVHVTFDGSFIRRVATLDEMIGIGEPNDTHRIVDSLVAARLVVVSSDKTSQAKVELAHEAIIRSWPRLRGQVEQFAQFLRSRTKLEIAARQWLEANKDPEFLYPQGELTLLRSGGQLERHRNELSPTDQEFVAESERALWRRQQRMRTVALALGVLTVLIAGLAGLAFHQRQLALMAVQEVTEQRALAESSAEEANRQKVAAEQSKAQAEAAAALANAQRAVAEEQSALARQQTKLASLANLSAASAISPDGARMLLIKPTGNLSIVDLATGDEVGQIADASHGIIAATFSPDAARVATGAIDGAVSIYNNMTLMLLRTLAGHRSAVRRIAFSPDASLLASGGDDSTVRVWSTELGASIAEPIITDSPVVGVAFSPDGKRLIITSQKGSLYVFDTQKRRIIR